MYNKLLEIGPFAIYTYGIALSLASFITVFFFWKLTRYLAPKEETIIDISIVSGFFALVTGRIIYILQTPQVFEGNILRMILITYFPGLSGVGAILGLIICFLILLKIKNLPILRFTDAAVISLTLGIIIMNLIMHAAGSIPGTTYEGPLSALLPGDTTRSHAVALYYSIAGLITYIATLIAFKVFKIVGLPTALFCILFGIALIIIQWYTRNVLKFSFTTFGQLVGVILLTVGIRIAYRVYKVVQYNDTKKDVYEPGRLT